MEWKKAPEELVNFLNDKMKDKNCDYRKMFGYPAYFINGYMFAGLHGDNLFLRLSDADIATAKKSFKGIDDFAPMPSRPMKGYVVLSKTVYLDGKLFGEMIAKSIAYTSTLPPKKVVKKKTQ
jgi:TfoX/Sxy family transcriptional regulator of competence genes